MFEWRLYKQAVSEWNRDKVPMWAAAISYYAVFSAAPLLLIAISIAGYFFGRTSVQIEIIKQTTTSFGPQTAEVLQGLIQQTANSSTNIMVSIVGIIVLFIGSSGVFGQLKDALNVILQVDRKQTGIWHVITDNSSSFAMVLVIGFLLLLFLLISTVISVLTSYFEKTFLFSSIVISVGNIVVSICIIAILFSLIYMILPDKKMRWDHVWPVAVVIALLFTLGKEVISFYISHFSGASTYGAAGSLVIILLWVFYSTQIFLYGAELIKCLHPSSKK